MRFMAQIFRSNTRDYYRDYYKEYKRKKEGALADGLRSFLITLQLGAIDYGKQMY